MNDFTKTWNELKNRYYCEKMANSPDSWYEELRKEFQKLGIKVPEVKLVTAEETFAYVCPDTEYEFPMVFILRKDGITNRNWYMNIIYDAICEYYRFSDFYDEITTFGTDELLSFCIAEYDIPVIRWYKVENTEMLNVKRLRCDSY